MSRALRKRRSAVLLAVALALGVGSLTQLVRAGAAATKPGPNLKRFYRQKPVWTACEDKMLCTWLTVPRSYLTKNTHGTFRIRVIKDPATGTRAQYQGALIMNPGGPGGSGYALIKSKTISDENCTRRMTSSASTRAAWVCPSPPSTAD
jgi:hypothetical protein